ncbi:unnamed protein product [Cuscuta epithymum]|uniref:Uncharacterized protein n=1 Tax=Cuscuta epithymum TaxID=186058 RepID=A0AAV0EX54_9ASTE|nr:unnamed protein product [Cuscuta epithymum]
METELSADWPRRRLRKAGHRCCIFRIPQGSGDAWYQPSTVSIGPYHHGREELRMMEENKRRSLATLLERTKSMGLTLEDYFVKVKSLEEEARDCYSETILLQSHEFVAILVVDGCFIVELFRKAAGRIPFEEGDPIFSVDWTFWSLVKDLTCVENQIPFVVLRELFDLTELPDDGNSMDRVSWSTLIYDFFEFFLPGPSFPFPSDRSESFRWRHLLDFLLWNFTRRLPVPGSPPRKSWSRVASRLRGGGTRPAFQVTRARVIPCISKLRVAGIKLQRRDGENNFLDVRFEGGAIKMPLIKLDGFMAAFLRNCVAYERCIGYERISGMTEYAIFLDRLIDTYKDVEVLCDHHVMENSLGTVGEVATFVNELVKGVNIDKYYLVFGLSELFGQVNQYYNNSRDVYWATLKNRYFNSSWSIISFFAAIVLLLLSVTQTIFTILAYVKPLSH